MICLLVLLEYKSVCRASLLRLCCTWSAPSPFVKALAGMCQTLCQNLFHVHAFTVGMTTGKHTHVRLQSKLMGNMTMQDCTI